MDLRPRIAARIVDALLVELNSMGVLSLQVQPEVFISETRDRLVEIALSKIRSESINFPPGSDWLVSSHPEVVEQFLSKYPSLRKVVDDCTAKVLEIDPLARIVLEVMNDPEGCHTCREGQGLYLNALVSYQDPGDYDEYLRKDALFQGWWDEYSESSNPEDLFRPRFGFRPGEGG